jgi:hypothetical protein
VREHLANTFAFVGDEGTIRVAPETRHVHGAWCPASRELLEPTQALVQLPQLRARRPQPTHRGPGDSGGNQEKRDND